MATRPSRSVRVQSNDAGCGGCLAIVLLGVGIFVTAYAVAGMLGLGIALIAAGAALVGLMVS